ncbi:MAG: hypothetical protein WCC66_00910 [Rhizobiaceae bacterium]
MAMYNRLFLAVLFTGLLHPIAEASGVPTIPFVDGRWQGGTKGGPDRSDFEECWASTEFDDGTVFTLTKRRDGSWNLQLSNPGWRLPQPRRYAMVALVDFYPRLRIAAEAKNQTLLEIADLDHISLLGLIENGHTIDLASDGFNEKYELEGSAKIIQRIRNCFDQFVGEMPAAVNGPRR